MKLTDMHSHILPGVDDGSRNMEETLSVLRQAERQGVSHIVVTPHFHPGRYQVSAAQVLQTLEQVREQCYREQISVELIPGQECYFYSGLIENLDRGEALTMAGTGYVLVEFETDCRFSYLIQSLFSLREAGYEPILAHFERYDTLFEGGHLDTLKQHGYLTQMNFDMLVPRDRLFRKNPWRELVLDGYVDFLGSDCHGEHFRPLQIDEAMAWFRSRADASLQERILKRNIESMLQNRNVG